MPKNWREREPKKAEINPVEDPIALFVACNAEEFSVAAIEDSNFVSDFLKRELDFLL